MLEPLCVGRRLLARSNDDIVPAAIRDSSDTAVADAVVVVQTLASAAADAILIARHGAHADDATAHRVFLPTEAVVADAVAVIQAFTAVGNLRVLLRRHGAHAYGDAETRV